MTYGFVAKRHGVLLACLAAAGAASAQTAPGPWVCGTEMYVGRSNASAPTNFFTYEMQGGAAWGAGTAIGTVDANVGTGARDLNALAYNPRDNYLYAPKRVFHANPPASTTYVGMYRLGKNAAGQVEPVVMSPSASGADVFKQTLRIAGLPAEALGAAASFDRLGNYFMVNGKTSDVYLIAKLHEAQPDGPAVQAEKLDRLAETEAAWLADGFEAVTPGHVSGQRAITDFAVHPKESTHAQPVLYGMGDKVAAGWYLHRYRVDLASRKVHVSRKLIANMDAAGGYMASTAFRRDGKLFLYSADGKVYEVDADPASATKWTVVAGPLDATAANASDGASCMTSIHAEDDGNGAAPFMSVPNGAEQESLASVLDNDTAYLQKPVLSGNERNATLVSNSWQPAGGGAGPAAGGITLDPATGKVTVQQGTTPGTYTYEYQICVWPEVTPTGVACDKAQVVVQVTEEPVVAEDDSFGVVGATGPVATSVVANDKVAGVQAVLAGPGKNAELQAGSWAKTGGPATGNLTFDYATGTVTVPAGTPAGNYVYSYQLCNTAAPPKCDPAEVTLTVPAMVPPVIDAVTDAFGAVAADSTTVGSVFANDLVGGAAMVPGTNAALKAGSWVKDPSSPAGNLVLNTDGTVTVPPGTPVGAYTYTYEICALPGNAPCDQATVTLTVGSSGGAGHVTPVPANAPWALMLATLGIAGLARRARRKQG